MISAHNRSILRTISPSLSAFNKICGHYDFDRLLEKQGSKLWKLHLKETKNQVRCTMSHTDGNMLKHDRYLRKVKSTTQKINNIILDFYC
jgi:hypothetical protein